MLKYPTKQILPVQGGRASLVIDNDYLAHLHTEDERIDLFLGNELARFNCVRFANCEVLSEYVRFMAVFAQVVIIEDSSFDCEEIYFNLKNELEFRSGKIWFTTMKVEAKWVNIEEFCLMDGNQLIINASLSASLSGGFKLDTQLICQSQHISIDERSSIAASDLLLLPTKSLEIRGALTSRTLFIGEFNEKLQKDGGTGTTTTASVVLSGEVVGDRMSIMSSNDVLFSAGRVSVNELDCLSGKEVKVEKNCRLKARKLHVHAQSLTVDAVSVLEGTELSFLIEDKILLDDLSSFQIDSDGLLAFECRSLVCLCACEIDEEETSSIHSQSSFRSGNICISSDESIHLGGALKCKKLILKCQQRAADVIFQENTNFDLDSLLVIANGNGNGSRSRSLSCVEKVDEIGEVVFKSGSVILCSMFIAIEVDKEVVLKGSLKRTLCNSPNLSIKTSKSIKFVNCSVSVGETQLLFGDELVLDKRANVHVSGKLFLLHHSYNSHHPKEMEINHLGVLRIALGCVLVTRQDIVCQFGECYVEGTLASEEGSILLGRNDNQSPSRTPPEGTEKKQVKLTQVIKNVVQSLKPSSNPLSSLFKKIQDKRIELIQNIQRIIHLREEDYEQKSFVMEYIFISGEVRAKKIVMFVSKDISIQRGGNIKCTATWDNTAILMYSNRSVFQCSSELDASTVLIVSPIVFQLLSLIKAHNLSISAAAIFRLACLCNSTKTILKSPLILSGLNIVAPNLSMTLRKMRTDLVDSSVDIVMLIEKLAEARMEHREFDVFLLECMRLFKKHSHLALLHSLELVHFAFQIVNLVVPKTALIITVNLMSIIRATLFLLFSVKNIQKSIKRYLTSGERHNFILVEIVGEGMFSLYQVVGVVTSFTSLYNRIKALNRMNSSTFGVNIPKLKDLPLAIFNRTRELVSRGPLSTLSSVLGVFDTFVLNDYTKYAVGLFSYLPSSMSFSILNLSGELQLGMYVVNSSSTCSLNGSVVVLSYNYSSTNLTSFSPCSNVVICNGDIYETSFFGKVDRGVKISQKLLVLAGGRRIHEGGFHFGESVVLNLTKSFNQHNNKMIYSQIGGFSLKEWKLHQKSEFRSVSSSSPGVRMTENEDFDAFDSGVFVENVNTSVLRSGNVIESLTVGDGSVFFLKDVALILFDVKGAILVKNVQVKVSSSGRNLRNLSTLQIAGGNNSIVSDVEVDIDFSIHLGGKGHISIFSPSTNVNNCKTTGEGHVAFHNIANIGEHASIRHTGTTLLELKDERGLFDAISGNGKYSKIANDGQINFFVNDEFKLSSASDDEKLFLSEPSKENNQDFGLNTGISRDVDVVRKNKGIQLFSVKDIAVLESISMDGNDTKSMSSSLESHFRENQDVGIIAKSIVICQRVERKRGGLQLFSTEEDVVIKESIIVSEEGSIVIHAKNGNVVIEDKIEMGTIPKSVRFDRDSLRVIVLSADQVVKSVEKVELRAKNGSIVMTSDSGAVHVDPCNIFAAESFVVESKKGVEFGDIIVTRYKRTKSKNFLEKKTKKTIIEEAVTSCITCDVGDIVIDGGDGSVHLKGTSVTSHNGGVFQRGSSGIFNESSVTRTKIRLKRAVLGGLFVKEKIIENHENETICHIHSSKGVFCESEHGTIKNVGTIFTGNGVASFIAKDSVIFERRVLNHEIFVRKKGFKLSLSLFGCDIFSSGKKNSFFDNLKTEFLENYLPPIGNNPIQVARSLKDGNVPEIAANVFNALLLPGNLRFKLKLPNIECGLKYTDYEAHESLFDSLGEGLIEMDYLYAKAFDNNVEFNNAYGFVVARAEIIAGKALIERGISLSMSSASTSSGIGISCEAIRIGIFGFYIPYYSSPSFSIDVSNGKEISSVAVCQIGNAVHFHVNVAEWIKIASQSFFETVSGRIGKVRFDSIPSTSASKHHSISVGTSSMNLSDSKEKTSLVFDQTGLFSVNTDDFHVKDVHLKGSRCPVRGTESNSGDELFEYEKGSGTSLGIEYGNGFDLKSVKGLGLKRRNYEAKVKSSFSPVNVDEFHFKIIESYQEKKVEESSGERDKMCYLLLGKEKLTKKTAWSASERQNRRDVSLSKEHDANRIAEAKSSNFMNPEREVVKDKGFHVRFHYDHEYYLRKNRLYSRLRGKRKGRGKGKKLSIPFDDFLKMSRDLFQNGKEKFQEWILSSVVVDSDSYFQPFVENGGNCRDYESYDEFMNAVEVENAKQLMKDFVEQNYREIFFDTELDKMNEIEKIENVFLYCKITFEPDDPVVQEMNRVYADMLYPGTTWEELTPFQQRGVLKIRNYALMYRQTDQSGVELSFGEFVNERESMLYDYFEHNRPVDTSLLTTVGILTDETLDARDSLSSAFVEYLSLENPHYFDEVKPLFLKNVSFLLKDNLFDFEPSKGQERKYPEPGSGLLFFLSPPEKNGLEGIREYFTSLKDCCVDYFSHYILRRGNLQPEAISEKELSVDNDEMSFFSTKILKFVPLVNCVIWGFQSYVGYDIFTKRELDPSERLIEVGKTLDFAISFTMMCIIPSGPGISFWHMFMRYGKGIFETAKCLKRAGKALVVERSLTRSLSALKLAGRQNSVRNVLPKSQLANVIRFGTDKAIKGAGVMFRFTSKWFKSQPLGGMGTSVGRQLGHIKLSSPLVLNSGRGGGFAFAACGGNFFKGKGVFGLSPRSSQPFYAFAAKNGKGNNSKGLSSRKLPDFLSRNYIPPKPPKPPESIFALCLKACKKKVRPILSFSRKLISRYNTFTTKYPFSSSTITSGIVLFLGDYGAQKIEQGSIRGKIDWVRSGKMFGWGSLCVVHMYPWFRFCEAFKWLSKGNKYIVPLKKSLLTNFIYGPIGNSLFFMWILATEEKYSGFGGYASLVTAKLQRDFREMFTTSLYVWIPAVYGIFVFVPPEYRVIVNNIIGTFWMVYLSYLGHKKVEVDDSPTSTVPAITQHEEKNDEPTAELYELPHSSSSSPAQDDKPPPITRCHCCE